MARHRRMLAPINSIKHFVARTQLGVPSGTSATIPVVSAVDAPANASTDEVLQGAVIKAVFVEIWIISRSVLTQATMTLEKLPGTSGNPTFTNMLNLGAYENKKNILQTFQGIIPDETSGANPIAPIRGWFAIPKGKQRFGLGDRLVFNIATVSAILETCGMFIYKEYR